MLADSFDVCITVGVLLVLGAVALIWYLVYDHIRCERGRMATEAANQEEARQRAAQTFQRERQAEFDRRQRELESEARRAKQENSEKTDLAIAEAIRSVREAASERYQSAIPATTLQELEKRLREAQLMFSRSGKVLTVRVAAVPTGWLAIEWMVDPNFREPPRVTGRRNGVKLFVERAYKGMCCDILNRGTEYRFTFHVSGKYTSEAEDLEFVIKLPTPRQWLRKVIEPGEADHLSKREKRITQTVQKITKEDELWEKARRDAHEQIDATQTPDREKQKRKATLDAKIIDARDREPAENIQKVVVRRRTSSPRSPNHRPPNDKAASPEQGTPDGEGTD
jgi:hypothetical protein